LGELKTNPKSQIPNPKRELIGTQGNSEELKKNPKWELVGTCPRREGRNSGELKKFYLAANLIVL
jgi:hypothetical protein